MTEGHTERLETALDGKYRIERKLGEGGMATVYLAQDVKHERKVALKILEARAGRCDRSGAVPLGDQDDREPSASSHPRSLRFR